HIDADPGVVFVRGVYDEFKRRGSSTVVMGASFRSTAQIEALAGCDRLTISPDLLEKLEAETGELPRKLSPVQAEPGTATAINAARFAEDLAADPMATEKLRDGIAAFAKDLVGLRQTIADRLSTGA
ncbi:MAG TPA: transaldolase family protein, partial [Pseudoxanthomonas sp.]|nr:transaldolase family protein [Pseudoxanthomonas sp.]